MSKNEIMKKYEAERTKCLKWSRVMGYYRPQQSYNIGKQSEFNERVWFRAASECGCSCGCSEK